MMSPDIHKFFNLQRQIFGICPKSGKFFRLSDCMIFLRVKPTTDWLDIIELKQNNLDKIEEKIDEKEESLREIAREKGRKEAQKLIRKVDMIFTPRKLNPDDSKVIFHPIDYIVFDGMKAKDTIKEIVFLDKNDKRKERRGVQKSIQKVIEKGNYDWQTVRVLEDGKMQID